MYVCAARSDHNSRLLLFFRIIIEITEIYGGSVGQQVIQSFLSRIK